MISSLWTIIFELELTSTSDLEINSRFTACIEDLAWPDDVMSAKILVCMQVRSRIQ